LVFMRVQPQAQFILTTTTTLMVAWMGAGAASRGIQVAC
jgi:hypothetical protein